MGGVDIALEDRLYDPFVNPAQAINISGAQFVSTPVYYGFSPIDGVDNGSGRTLPIGALMQRNGFFGGAMIAFQEVARAREGACCANFSSVTTRQESSISRNNTYLFGLGGTRIGHSDWSVGASVLHAELRALDGVQLLYQGGDVRQDGMIQQYRAGLYRSWDAGHAAELIVMHHRLDMTHAIDEAAGVREEHDQTNGTAVRAGYQHSFATGWTLGGRLAGDWKWHPKIPNYDLMQIPRDPGNSSAYNVGIGLSRTSGAATFGLDVIYEPIWSHTWANAVEPTETADDQIIPAGQKTVDNVFVYDNARIRMGVHNDGEHVQWSLGFDMHRISYDLDQTDFVEAERRFLDQSWTEWTLSGGIGTQFSGFQVHYMARLTLGTGQPGVQRQWNTRADQFLGAGDWVVAPRGPLTLRETTILSHQISLIVPLAN